MHLAGRRASLPITFDSAVAILRDGDVIFHLHCERHVFCLKFCGRHSLCGRDLLGNEFCFCLCDFLQVRDGLGAMESRGLRDIFGLRDVSGFQDSREERVVTGGRRGDVGRDGNCHGGQGWARLFPGLSWVDVLRLML